MTAIAPTGDIAPAPADRRFLGHPIGLAYLAFTEAWERFSYYGMQALLVLYMVDTLLRPGHFGHVLGLHALRGGLEQVSGPLSIQALSSQIFGLYTAFVYVTPVFGGLIGDRLLGRRGAVTLGAVMMAAGHFLMAVEGAFLVALSLLVLGGGLIKGNIASQVGGLYAEHDPRRSDAFQIFVLSINIGTIASPLICGTLGELVGWPWGFGAAGVGMLIGLAIYLAGRRHLPPDVIRPRGPAAAKAPPLTAAEWRSVAALLVLIPILAVAFVANNQGFNVYLIWARQNAGLVVGAFKIPVTWLLSLGSIDGILCLSLSVWFWRRMAQRRIAPHEISKIVIGCALYALAWGTLALAAGLAERSGAKVPLALLVVVDFVGALGYANVLPVALALCSRAAPKAVNATMLGVFYLLYFITNLLVGWIGGFYEAMSHGAFWALHAALCAASGLVLVLLARPLKAALG